MNLNNMAHNSTYTKIAELLLKISHYEEDIESLRQNLNDKPNFDIYQIFMTISNNNKISSHDLSAFYSKSNLNSTLSESVFSNIIFFYDEDKDSSLSYSEFMSFILCDTNYTLRRNSHDKICTAELNSSLPFDINQSIISILNKEIELINTITQTNKVINIPIEDIFNEVKINEYITPTSIWKIFNLGYGNVSNNIYSSFDVENVMKRFDVNRDCKVDIDEFRTIMEFGKEEEIVNTGSDNNVIEYNVKGINGSEVKEDIISSNSKSRNTLCENSNNNSMYNNYTKNSKKSNHTISNIRHNDIENNLGEKENRKYYDTTYTNNDMKSSLNFDYTSNTSSGLYNRIINENTITHSDNIINNISSSSTLFLRKSPMRRCFDNKSNCFTDIQSFLRELMIIETEIERIKSILSVRSDYNIETIFRYFESQSKPDIININHMKNGLNSFLLYPSDDEVYLLMKRFDLNLKGYITYTEFFDMLTPFEKNLRDLVEMRTSTDNPDNDLLFETKNLIHDLLCLIMTYENQTENLRRNINLNRNILEMFFGLIDKEKKGYFTCEDLYYYVKNVWKVDIPKRKECDLLFIRLDRRRNGRIELWEVENELTKCDNDMI